MKAKNDELHWEFRPKNLFTSLYIFQDLCSPISQFTLDFLGLFYTSISVDQTREVVNLKTGIQFYLKLNFEQSYRWQEDTRILQENKGRRMFGI